MTGQGVKGLARDLSLINGSGSVAGLDDAELLGRYAGRGGDAADAAFEAIVARHGPMVLGVCRGVLHQSADAEDAFQATFMVLAQKAGSVRVADSLGPWLYGVARKVANKARTTSRKRQAREAPVDSAAITATDDREALDARPILFEELDRLPEKYRSPVILCHLEGLSHEEAARRLRWPVGTVSGRLSRARDLLRSRLTRRGIGVPTSFGAVAFLSGEAGAVPVALLRSTVQSAMTVGAGGTLPLSIITLTRGAITAMLVQKLKLAAVAGSTFSLLAIVGGYAAGQIGHQAQTPPPKQEAVTTVAPAEPPKQTQKVEAPPFTGKFQSINDKITIPMIANDNIIAVTPKDGRSISAMVFQKGTWETYQAPEGTKVKPLMSTGLLAIDAEGDVQEIAAFSFSYGSWVKWTLPKPTKLASPVVLDNSVFYLINHDLYTFSYNHNSWRVLHLEGTEKPKIEWNSSRILVQHDDKFYIFSFINGKWSEGLTVPVDDAE